MRKLLVTILALGLFAGIAFCDDQPWQNHLSTAVVLNTIQLDTKCEVAKMIAWCNTVTDTAAITIIDGNQKLFTIYVDTSTTPGNMAGVLDFGDSPLVFSSNVRISAQSSNSYLFIQYRRKIGK